MRLNDSVMVLIDALVLTVSSQILIRTTLAYHSSALLLRPLATRPLRTTLRPFHLLNRPRPL